MFPRRQLPRSSEMSRTGAMQPPQVEAGGGLSASWGPQGLSIKDNRPAPIWAKITGQAASTNRYAWTQIDDGDTEGTFSDNLSEDFAAAGTSDEAGGCAYEITGSTTVPVDSVVQLWPAGDGSFWVFRYGTEAGAATVSQWKEPVRVATTAALPASTYANGSSGVGATITGDANGALAAQDGVTLAGDDQILVKDESSGLRHGIYTLTQVGSAGAPFILTRRTDADEATEFPGAAVVVLAGTANADTVWLCTNDTAPTLGTTAITWAKPGVTGTVASSLARLSADYTITADGNYEDTGLAITLPSAGDYFVFGSAVALGQVATFSGSYAEIDVALYNQTGAAYLAYFHAIQIITTGSPDRFASIGLTVLVTAAASMEVRLHALRNSATTWTTSKIIRHQPTHVSSQTHIGYLKLS